MLNPSWVLFDFGKRSAGLRQARQLLTPYYVVRDAQAALNAARQTGQIASESLAEARAKHDAGAGTLSDQLQAQTAYRRALLDRVSAEGDAHSANGGLAVAVGLDANTPLHVTPSPPVAQHDTYAQGVDQLLDKAKARQSKLVAARDNIDVVRPPSRSSAASCRTTRSTSSSHNRCRPRRAAAARSVRR